VIARCLLLLFGIILIANNKKQYPIQKTFFFPVGFSVRMVGAGELSVLDFPIQPRSIQSPYELAIFECP
jgi:hypothetical protein